MPPDLPPTQSFTSPLARPPQGGSPRDILTAILESPGRKIPALPELQAKAEPGLFQKFIAEILAEILEAIRSFFAPWRLGPAGGDFLRYSLWLIVGLIILVLLLWLARPIYRLLKARAGDLSSEIIPLARGSNLEEELRQAELAEDWPRALRLRWKLFLRRQQLSSECTPLEYFSQASRRNLSASFSPNVSEQYRGMFGEPQIAREIFPHYDSELGELEKRNRQEQGDA